MMEMKYFVLKPRGIDRHALASREAMRAYAYVIEAEDPLLAKELLRWAAMESPEDEMRGDVD